jgi:hypothetical protein
MQTSAIQRTRHVSAKRAVRLAAFFALAAVVVFGASWAKVSRYDLRAVPSPHFSKSVKVARVLFHSGLGDEPQALIAAGANLPEPDWNGFTPLSPQFEIAGAPPQLFVALRAPPSLL